MVTAVNENKRDAAKSWLISPAEKNLQPAQIALKRWIALSTG